jgi:hypothetical protein
VEYNFIHDLFNSIIGDAGAIYIPRTATDRGNQINSNIIANVLSPDAWGIYIDDGMCGVTVKNNVLYNPGGYAFFGSGSNHEITGNMILFKDLPVYHGIVHYNKYVVAFNPKFAGMLEESMDRLNASPNWPTFLTSFKKIPTDPEANALWRERWPEIFLVADDLSVSPERLSDPYCPTNNFGTTIKNNFAISDLEGADYYDDQVRFGGPDPSTLHGKYYNEWNTVENNLILDTKFVNNYFVNAADGNYTTIEPSIGDNGFGKIGRY